MKRINITSREGLACASTHACSVSSVVFDSATPWTVASQAPLFMGFSRQEYWSGLVENKLYIYIFLLTDPEAKHELFSLYIYNDLLCQALY